MTEPIRQDQKLPDKQAELLARRKRRSIALGLVLGAIVIIFYVLTIVKLGPQVFDRAL